jgi:hypothetical protein
MRSADTSPEAQNKHGELLRQMTPEPKLQRAFSLPRRVRGFAEGGLRERYPQASAKFFCAPSARNGALRCSDEFMETCFPMTDPDSLALPEIESALTSLAIPFCVVGSLASSARGKPRATMGVDLLVRTTREHAARLSETLGPGWSGLATRITGGDGAARVRPHYRSKVFLRRAGVDVEGIAEALRWRRAFNVFNLQSGLKFFPAFDEFHNVQRQRATTTALADGTVKCPLATAEDMVLAKLQWYRAGGEASEHYRSFGGPHARFGLPPRMVSPIEG